MMLKFDFYYMVLETRKWVCFITLEKKRFNTSSAMLDDIAISNYFGSLIKCKAMCKLLTIYMRWIGTNLWFQIFLGVSLSSAF